MTRLHIPDVPLHGLHMIEASAGTGKTWTIAALYLRLLLERSLPVEKILVVTYTNAATAELRSRIRQRLLDAQYDAAVGESDDEVLQDIFSRVAPPQAQVLLTLALESFDLASIHTIHGFCQRALAERAFESGLPFESELASDDRRVLHEAMEDFWRREIVSAGDPLWLSWLLDRLPGPDALLQLLSAQFGKPYLLHVLPATPDAGAVRRYTESCARMQALWQGEGAAASAVLHAHPGLNQTSYKPAQIHVALETFGHWLASGANLPVPEIAAKLGARALADKTKKGHTPPEHNVFAAIDDLLDAAAAAEAAFEAQLAHLLQRALIECETNVRAARQRLATRSFDDLLLDLHAALLGDGGEALAIALRQRYGAALIDEFQDTDPLQYGIFAKVFIPYALEPLPPCGGGAGERGSVSSHTTLSPSPSDETTSQSTKPASGQVAGYPIKGRGGLIRPAPEALAGLGAFCTFVGDPKQAIYSFRGADLRAYLAAKAQAGVPLVLDTNRRSTRDLIAAVNTVFGKNAKPFLDEELQFEPVQAPSDAPAPILLDGKPLPALALWFMPRVGKELEPRKSGKNAGKLGLIAKNRANPTIAAAVATSIAGLLNASLEDRVVVDDKGVPRKLEGQDIAVLVKSHHQGQLVRECLQELGVASVRYGQDSIFETQDALEVERVLLAIAHPGREGLVRSALATRLMGVRGDALAAFAPTGISVGHGDAWLQQLEDFHRWHVLARDHGFIRMWRTWQLEAKVAPRLLALPDGERLMTNLLHLSDLLATLAHDDKLGIEALAKHLADARNDARSENNSGEGRLLRLESDENLVRIVTIHTSKGLEYPITYCPFLWDGGLRENIGPVRYHDPAQGHRAALDFGSPEREEHQAQAVHEARAEALRLAYVALTRARQHCVLVWGAMTDADASPLAWLLHGSEQFDFGAVSDDYVRTALRQWQDACAHIQVAELPQGEGRLLPPAAQPAPALHARPYPTRAMLPWRMHSFTAWLVNPGERVPESDELPERDELLVPLPLSPALSREGRGSEVSGDVGVSGFPTGANAGTCLHDMFERADFVAPEPEVIAASLEEFGFAADLNSAATQLLKDTLQTPLSETLPPLREIPRTQQIREMEFMLPVTAPDMATLATAVGKGAGADGKLSERIRSLNPAHLGGFLKGFVDLVFAHEDRYYVLDYKSNYLGPLLRDYAQPQLAAAMAEAMYDLQALLYEVALHLALQQRLPDYDYERHCGGSLYLFLRGMQPAVPGSGVFAWRPTQAMIERVAACLMTKTRVFT